MESEDRTAVIEHILETLPLIKNRLWKPIQAPIDGLPHSQVLVMHLLGEHQTVNMTQLALMMRVSNQQMTKIVDGLVKRDFVGRQISPENRRSIKISLTDSGHLLLREMKKEMINKILLEMNCFTDEEMQQLGESFSIIKTIIKDKH